MSAPSEVLQYPGAFLIARELQFLAGAARRKGSYGAMEQRERLQRLDRRLIGQIDKAVIRAGEYGEVRLIISKGQVRYIHITVSEPVQGSREAPVEHAAGARATGQDDPLAAGAHAE